MIAMAHRLKIDNNDNDNNDGDDADYDDDHDDGKNDIGNGSGAMECPRRPALATRRARSRLQKSDKVGLFWHAVYLLVSRMTQRPEILSPERGPVLGCL